MATDKTWANLKYFNKNENWGGYPPRDTPEARKHGAEVISDELLLELDRFREVLNTPFIVTCGVDTAGHATDSKHYEANGACAVDIVIPDIAVIDHLDRIFTAKDMKFRGIGYYPFWQWKGKMVGGFHLDMRPLVGKLKRATWLGVPKSVFTGNASDKGQSYVALDAHNYFKFCRRA